MSPVRTETACILKNYALFSCKLVIKGAPVTNRSQKQVQNIIWRGGGGGRMIGVEAHYFVVVFWF